MDKDKSQALRARSCVSFRAGGGGTLEHSTPQFTMHFIEVAFQMALATLR